MAYTVFALKWRPKDFDEIIGQPHVVSTLKNAIEKQRLAHAFLFAGPRGVGKTSTARILAKSLNCKNGPTIKPCSKCPACTEITEGRSLDVIEIDGASNRGIDEIRALRENVKFSPVSGKFKIYIIDEVHQITSDGFNALLKTLEEPPEFVKFIFATTHPQKVMPTILSRCQRFDFRRISVMEITEQLRRIVASEKIEVDDEVLVAIAKASDGALRDAESALDQMASFSKGKVSLKDVISVLGIVEQEALFEITDKIIHKDPAAALNLLNDIIDGGKDTGVFLSNLIEHFRNLMVAKVSGGDPKLIDLPVEVCARLLQQSNALSLEEILGIFNILAATQEMSKRLESLRIPLEVSLVRLTQLIKKPATATGAVEAERRAPTPKKEDIRPKNSPLAAEPPVQHQPSHKPPVKDAAPQPAQDARPDHWAPAVPLDKIKENWQNIITSLGRVKISAATYLNEGEPEKMQGNTVVISFPGNYSLHKESLESKENKAIVEKCFSELFNTVVRVNFILSAQSKQRPPSENNPFIKSALDMFGGRIINDL
ncbi:MAG: DNA polymerase III subunit gamma/tau [Candidatus Omnitrophota bacterium]|nr:DNA polymerase III subunit gamma/tau [Candidatus Omnitrophota bacterium]